MVIKFSCTFFWWQIDEQIIDYYIVRSSSDKDKNTYMVDYLEIDIFWLLMKSDNAN